MRISKDDAQTRAPKLGYFGGLATRRAADARAQALLSIVHEIQAAGFVRLKDITDEPTRGACSAGPATGGTAQALPDCLPAFERLSVLDSLADDDG